MINFYAILAQRLKGIQIVSKDKNVLLERRYIVNRACLGIYLHKCLSPDLDPNVFHDHPWSWSFSIVLSGYYIEIRPGYGETDVARKRGCLSINYLSRDTFHRLSEISRGGAWTLYIRGKKVKKDGFLLRRSESQWTHILAEDSDYEYAEVLE